MDEVLKDIQIHDGIKNTTVIGDGRNAAEMLHLLAREVEGDKRPVQEVLSTPASVPGHIEISAKFGDLKNPTDESS